MGKLIPIACFFLRHVDKEILEKIYLCIIEIKYKCGPGYNVDISKLLYVPQLSGKKMPNIKKQG